MKRLLISLVLISLSVITNAQTKIDSAKIFYEYNKVHTSKIVNISNCNCDSLKMKLFLSEYKVKRVIHYLKICQHNPSQTKFLVSWIARAVKD